VVINTSSSKTLSLVNGVATDSIAINNRGLAYGDGVFETVFVVDAVPQFFEPHLQRLQLACQRLNLPLNLTLLRAEINQLLIRWDAVASTQAVLKIIITRGYSGRGYRYDPAVGVDHIVTLDALIVDVKKQQQGINVTVCKTPLSINSITAGIKHLNRLENVLARAEWHDENITEGLMLDTDGFLIEGTMSNVFIVSEGRLLTPKLDGCGVVGIIRNIIIEKIAKQLNILVSIEQLSLDDVQKADEIFICNSLIGVCPVVDIDGDKKGIGTVTRKIQQELSVLVAHA
jgi:4-amino-4-deoxychorismate lyase